MPILPEEFLQQMHNLPGFEFDAFVSSYNKRAFSALRMNPLKYRAAQSADPAGISCTCTAASAPAARLHACFPSETFFSVPWCADGFYFIPSEHFRPGLSAYHDAGVYYIQEPSAMAAAACLDAQPGETVLDLCAAPGGKSTQIASSMLQSGLLIANEIVPSRAKTLSGNIERLGIRNAIVTNESPQHLSSLFPAYFDRILVDAPCSGEGMFRKNPDAASEWSPQAVQNCAQRQDEILSCAAHMLLPGGIMVYSTCTLNPIENEGTLTRFLKIHPDFHLIRPPFSPQQLEAFGFDCGRPDWYEGAPDEISRSIRILPHHTNGEGHFIAILKKDGIRPSLSRTESGRPDYVSSPESICLKTFENNQTGIVRRKSAEHAGKKVKKKERFRPAAEASGKSLLQNFLRSNLSDCTAVWDCCPSSPLKLISFGDQLFLLPAHAPSLSGIRVLRPGLHLGTIKKDVFRPAHALAMTLSPDDVIRRFDLTPDQASSWIAGQTLPVSSDIPAGWTLITAAGYSLGWGKCANGIMKNHYPKGLRR